MGSGARADDRLRRSRLRVRRRHRRGDAGGDPPGHPAGDVADVPHRRRHLRRADVPLGPLHVPRQQQAAPAEGAEVRRAAADRQLGAVQRRAIGNGSRPTASTSPPPAPPPSPSSSPTRSAKVLAGRTITPPRPNIPKCRTGVVLRLGDRLNDVHCLERHLRSLGFDVAVNNQYGPRPRPRSSSSTTPAAGRGTASPTVGCSAAIGALRAARRAPVVRVGADPATAGSGPAVRCLRRALHARGYLAAAHSDGSPPVGRVPRCATSGRSTGSPPARSPAETLPRLGIHRPRAGSRRRSAAGDGGPAVGACGASSPAAAEPIPHVGGYNARVATWRAGARGAARPPGRRGRRRGSSVRSERGAPGR